MRCGMIEELRQGEANLVQARPVQIAKHNPLVRLFLRALHQTELFPKIVPSLAVIDHSIDPRPKLRIHRLTELLLPPEVQRQIRIQIREKNARQLNSASAVQSE